MRPRVCVVGPLVGRSGAINQGETLARLLGKDGYRVRMTSPLRGPLGRTADMLVSLARWRRDLDVVVVMVYSGRAFAVADVVSRWVGAMGKALILALHGGNLPSFTRNHPRWVSRVLSRADALVAPSNYLADFYDGRGLATRVIPNTLAVDEYTYRARTSVEPKLIWMRAFDDIYRPEMAVEVLHHLESTFPAANLTMAGPDAGSAARVRALATAKGLATRIGFPGVLDMAGKAKEFARHDIYVNTNRVDNLPISILEAGAFGLPIVSTNVGGIPQLLEHETTALLVEPDDVAGMAKEVTRLIDEPGLAERLSAAGRRLAEAHSWANVAPRWSSVLEEVMHGP